MEITHYLFALGKKNENTTTICKYMSVHDIRVIFNDFTLTADAARDKYLEYLETMYPNYDTIFIFPNCEKDKSIKIIYEQ